MKKTLKLCFWLSSIILVVQIQAQQELPRDYIPKEEIVSLNSNLNFADALDILSEYSINFASKPIFDPTNQSGEIGIDINSMPWKKALEIILSRRGLWYVEKEHFYQIVVAADKTESLNRTAGSGDNQSLTLGSREVKIETIFFEGDRKALSEIGIDWSTFYNGTVDISAEQMGALEVNESFLDATIKIPNRIFNVSVEALLKVFDSKNVGRVLAQPQVVVTEGNEGSIQVGQDFSIKTRDFAGNIIDRFYSTGTILRVTPYILTDEEKGSAIVLNAHVERSQASPDVVSTIIKKSEANSFVQLFDGEETLIAGLYSTEKTTLRKGIPILKDLPPWFLGLRYLTGYNRVEEIEKELIIIIRASLLPDVFVRKENRHNKYGLSAQDRVNRYRSSRPKLERRLEPYRNAKIERKNNSGNDNRNSHSPPPVERQSRIQIGKIVHIENNLVLVQWMDGFNASILDGKSLTVIRRIKPEKFAPVGKISIKKSMQSKTLGQVTHNRGNVQVGDKVVVRL